MRCSEEIPSVRRAEKAFAEKRLKVLWIGFQDRQEKIRSYIERQGIRMDVGFDEGDRMAKQLGIRYGAGIAVLNEQGIVKKRLAKGFSEKSLIETIRGALERSKVTAP